MPFVTGPEQLGLSSVSDVEDVHTLARPQVVKNTFPKSKKTLTGILFVTLIAVSITNKFLRCNANLVNIPYFVLCTPLKKRIGHMFLEENLILHSICKAAVTVTSFANVYYALCFASIGIISCYVSHIRRIYVG